MNKEIELVLDEAALYIVGTPIGNIEDLSPRAKKILSSVDFIACEDTRVSAKLLAKLGISNKLISFHEHNKVGRVPQLIQSLQNGSKLALVSDAGMPCISDPGFELVEACIKNNLKLTAVPGATAATTALAVSGLSPKGFIFIGFLERKEGKRRKQLQSLSHETATLIFYEAPHRLLKSLNSMCEISWSQRRICVARELTKTYEEILYMSVGEAREHYSVHQPRGEFVLVVEGAGERYNNITYEAGEAEKIGAVNSQVVEMAKDFIKAGIRPSEAVKLLKKYANCSRTEAYDLLENLKN